MAVVVGLDIGTTGTKAVFVDEHFKIIADAYKPYDFISNDHGFVEQNPHDWWDAAICTIRECVKKSGIKDIKGICLSTQGATLVCVDDKGIPLSNAIVWVDVRAGKQGKYVNETYGKDFVYKKTGWRSQNCFNFLQILWIKDNDIELFNKTAKFLSTNEYINFKLTGEYVGDPSNAAISGLYNITQKKLDDELLEILGICKTRVAKILESGKQIGCISDRVAKELGLPSGIPVFNGGHDQYMAAVSVGAIANGDILLSCGTSWCITSITDTLVFDTVNYSSPGLHVLDDLYGSMAYTPAGGAALEWFRKNLLNNGEALPSYMYLNEIAEQAPSGANGVMFMPHFSGTSYPTWSDHSRASLLGLNLLHGQSDVVRAVMEGVGFEINWVLESVKANVQIGNTIKALGGATKSHVWMQIVSDITGLTVYKSTVSDAPPIGTAIIAGVNSGFYKNIDMAIKGFNNNPEAVQPRVKENNLYQELYDEYKRRFKLLQECYE